MDKGDRRARDAWCCAEKESEDVLEFGEYPPLDGVQLHGLELHAASIMSGHVQEFVDGALEINGARTGLRDRIPSRRHGANELLRRDEE